jgi:hypothetical protein
MREINFYRLEQQIKFDLSLSLSLSLSGSMSKGIHAILGGFVGELYNIYDDDDNNNNNNNNNSVLFVIIYLLTQKP